MHELSITQSILDIAVSSAENAGAKKVNGIKITLGELTGCVPQYIQEYFDLVSEGTIAERAKLYFKSVPAMVECSDCGEKSKMERFRFSCPKCGSIKVKIISGKEFLVESIDIED